jgi:ankyrin repeat protein
MHEGRDTDLRDSARAKLAKALLKAVTDGDAATVRLFASSFALDLRDGEGRTLLMLAAECGRVEVVKFLLDSGVDVNEENVIQDYVRLPNGAALYPGPTMTVAELASDLPGSVVVSGRIETALSLTSPSAHPETRELLIKAGAK